MTELEKLDELMARFDVNYAQAKEALDASSGDVAQALLYLESSGAARKHGFKENAKQAKEESEAFVKSTIEQIKEIIQEGNVTKVRLRSRENILVEVPATIGVIGIGVMLFSPLMLAVSALGAVAAISKELTFEIEKADGTIEKRDLRWPDLGFGKTDKEQQSE